jgi:LPXTG-motif cell wall-anchored protein
MMIKMRKKIIAVICVIALTLSLPMLAWAADSPSHEEAVSNGVVLDVTAGSGTLDSVTASSTQASNVQLSATDEVLASFEIEGDATDIDLTFNVGTKWAGYTCTIFIEHNDETTEVRTAVVAANGTITIHVDKLSLFTLVVDTATAPASGGSGTDTSPTSPKTGVDTSATATVVTGITITMAIAAVFVAFALRKKIAQ